VYVGQVEHVTAGHGVYVGHVGHVRHELVFGQSKTEVKAGLSNGVKLT